MDTDTTLPALLTEPDALHGPRAAASGLVRHLLLFVLALLLVAGLVYFL